MAAPTSVTCTNGSWTKVATNVLYGQIGFDKIIGLEYRVTYVLTGATAPSDLATAHIVTPGEVLPIAADEGIDVYVWCAGKDGDLDGSVIVEI